jgi:hypothetical protein
MRFTSPAALACLATLAASVAVYLVRQPDSGERRAEEATPVEVAPSSKAEAFSNAAPVASAASLRRLPSESLQAALPELTAAVDDWRAFAPEALVVELDGGLRVPFDVTRVEAGERRTVLTAHLARENDGQHVLDGTFLVATAVAADRWDAVIVLPDAEYRLTVRGGQARVERAADYAIACGADAAPQTSTLEVAPAPGAAATVTSGLTVDVLFLYNAEALAERNHDRLAIDADCSNYIAASNAVLANSKIATFAWRYLGAEAAPAYKTTESNLDDLRAMRGAGELAAFVEGIQKDRGADQVLLLAGGRKTDAVGWAWIGGNTAHSTISYPFITYGDGTRATTVASYMTVCHELAHNFGCNHQRQDPSTQAVDGDGKYHYAHVTDGKSGPTGSIMAVYLNSANMTRVPYFSTAEVSYEGRPLGIGAGETRAAMNARILSENAARLAGLQSAPAGPAIVEHPRSVTASAGERVTLSVKATGDNLAFRWLRNGAVVSGATSDRLELASVNAAQAGDYHVEVSNPQGTATSFTATVAIAPTSSSTTVPTASAPTTAPSTSGASSGGGSGGGSTGGLAALALAALAAGRALRAR